MAIFSTQQRNPNTYLTKRLNRSVVNGASPPKHEPTTGREGTQARRCSFEK
jgi:hypothetical protein